MNKFINVRVYSKSKNESDQFKRDSDPNLFYHFSLEKEIPSEIIKTNPNIQVKTIEEINSLINDKDFTDNHNEELLYQSFGHDLIDMSKALFEKFTKQTINDFKNIKEMIHNNVDHEKVSREFHRLKSTFATFGLELSRSLIEKKQKQTTEYSEDDINEINFSFNKDLIAMDNFYKNIK
jgi:hypothetical protein